MALLPTAVRRRGSNSATELRVSLPHEREENEPANYRQLDTFPACVPSTDRNFLIARSPNEDWEANDQLILFIEEQSYKGSVDMVHGIPIGGAFSLREI